MTLAEAPSWTARTVQAIGDIAAADWDRLNPTANPFLRHAFLKALEDTGCVGRDSGWLPMHIAVDDGDGKLVGVAPTYLKGHSQGEFVFDHGWAEAFERAGGRYYPKMQIAVPFTPATGPRFLVGPGPGAAERRDALIGTAVELCRRMELSSLHVTFATEAEWAALGRVGLSQRRDQQFHFEDAGYGDFEGFLTALNSRKRKDLRKERAAALDNGIEVHWLTGSDLTEEVWDAFFAFYMDTGRRKWGYPYLNRAFFSALGAVMADRILLIMAKRDGRWIAGALNVIGPDTLYGRYWGCLEDHRFLHFEICYYQAMDYALAHGLKRVEAGAQGGHKLARGYRPVDTYSAHWIADPGFRRAVDDFLKREGSAIDAEKVHLDARTPFRKGPLSCDTL